MKKVIEGKPRGHAEAVDIEDIERYRELLHLKWLRAICWVWLTKYQHLFEDRDKCRSALKKLIEEDPENTYANVNLSLILLYIGYFKEAEEIARRITERDPSESRGWRTLSWVYSCTDRPVEMLRPLVKAVEVDPDNPEVQAHFEFVKKSLLRSAKSFHELGTLGNDIGLLTEAEGLFQECETYTTPEEPKKKRRGSS